ncbi:MAG: transposase [Pyrinomonadaceae bacterium]
MYEGGKESSHVNVVEFNESFQSYGPEHSTAATAGGAETPDPEVVGRAVRRRFTAEYKRRILAEVDAAAGSGAVGRIIRREGLYSSQLTTWRKARRNSERLALEPKKRGPKPTPENPLLQAENTKLKRENVQLHKKLHTAELMIDLQKKVSQLLGITLPVLEQSDDDEVNS